MALCVSVGLGFILFDGTTAQRPSDIVIPYN
jgi:hypothetical protein